MVETTGCSPRSIVLFSHSNVISILAHGHPDKDDISKPLLQLGVAIWLSSDQWSERENTTWQLLGIFLSLVSLLLLSTWMWQLKRHLRSGVDLWYGSYISWNSRIGAWVPEDPTEKGVTPALYFLLVDFHLREGKTFSYPLIFYYFVSMTNSQPNLK